MKQKDKQRLLAARKEWLYNALKSKQKDRWIEVEELYNDYIEYRAARQTGNPLIDEVSRDAFRHWIRFVDFVEFRIFPKKHANNIRKYRLKQEKSKCRLSAIGQRVQKLKYLISGIPIFRK